MKVFKKGQEKKEKEKEKEKEKVEAFPDSDSAFFAHSATPR